MFIFDITMKNCNVNINDNIFFGCEPFPLTRAVSVACRRPSGFFLQAAEKGRGAAPPSFHLDLAYSPSFPQLV